MGLKTRCWGSKHAVGEHKKRVYDCSYTRFRCQKMNKKRRNARTIARTCVSKLGVLVGVKTRVWGFKTGGGGSRCVFGARDACLGARNG